MCPPPEPRSVEWRDRDRVEMGHAVGLGPQRDLPRFREGLVLGGEKRFTIESDREPILHRAETEAVPVIGSNLCVYALNLLPIAVFHPVEADAVLKRIGAHDVVVVWRGEAHG